MFSDHNVSHIKSNGTLGSKYNLHHLGPTHSTHHQAQPAYRIHIPSEMTDAVTIRRLEPQDGENGLFAVLSQLTIAPAISSEKLAALIQQERQANIRHTLVGVNAEGKVIATGAVLFEQKLIRSAGICAHIEDIVVDESARGNSLGKKIIAELVRISRERGCYKVILDCADDNIAFYEKCGFKAKERQMALYF